MSFTVEAAEHEIENLTIRLKESEQIKQRLATLEKFVELAKQLSSNGSSGTVELSEKLPERRKNRTADLAAKILGIHNSLHIGKLVRQMKAIGWNSSGDEKKDEQAVAGALYRASERFESLKGGNWKIKSVPRN